MMNVQLKIGEVINIIRIVPKALHALGLTMKLATASRPREIKVYFSDTRTDLDNKNFDSLPYIQFKTDPAKSKGHFKPVYNDLEQAYQFCFVETDATPVQNAEVVLFYEGR